MSEKTTKELIGERIRKYRNARGWTLEELGDRVGYKKNTVSKWENEGLDSLTQIEALNAVLGCDLQCDSFDEEGIVGEVGRHILIELIRNKGYLEYKTISSKNYLYGMDDDRVSKEILKLSKLGMAERDIFVDFLDNQRDIVFLTAKGLITCKNGITNPIIYEEIRDLLGSVETYENMLKDKSKMGLPQAKNFDEYIKMRPGERLIRQISLYDIPYKYWGYVFWLKREFEFGFEKETIQPCDQMTLFPSISFYHDAIWKMSLGVSRDNICELIEECDDRVRMFTVDKDEFSETPYSEQPVKKEKTERTYRLLNNKNGNRLFVDYTFQKVFGWLRPIFEEQESPAV